MEDKRQDCTCLVENLVLQQSLLSFWFWKEKVHSGALISPVWFLSPILWSYSGSLNISCLPFVHSHLWATWFSPGMNQKRALRNRMSLGVCFLHHKGFTRVGPCLGLSSVWCSQGLLLPSRLSVAGICEPVPTSGAGQWCSSGTASWIGNEMGMLKIMIPVSPPSRSFWSAAVKCFEERSFKVLVALEPLPVWLSSCWPMVWGLHAFCWLAHLQSELHTEGLEGNGSIPIQPFSHPEGWRSIFSPPASCLT